MARGTSDTDPVLFPSIRNNFHSTIVNSSLGTLSVFAREIRDLIYKETLIRDDLPFELREVRHPREKETTTYRWRNVEFGVLHTSATIRCEAMAILFDHGMFGVDESRWPHQLGRRGFPWVDRIMNLNVGFEQAWCAGTSKHIPLRQLKETYPPVWIHSAKPLSFFAGSHVKRKICNVTIRGCTSRSCVWMLLNSPLAIDLSNLIGFRKVHLTFRRMSDMGKVGLVFRDSDFDEVVVWFATELEEFLGSSEIDMLAENGNARRITFHPRKQ